MGICHSKKIKKPNIANNANQIEKAQQPQKQNLPDHNQKEEPPKKKHEENDHNLENDPEIIDENIHNDNMKNVQREFLPNQIYTQHLNSILRSLQENKNGNAANLCQFGQTEPIESGDGICILETYGSYGKKSIE